MKKSFCIIILFVFAGYCFCQEKNNSEGFIGTTHGISFSQIDLGKGDNTRLTPQPGYSGGIAIVYASEPLVGILLEFNYIQKGWKILPDSSEKYSRRLSYYEVPFMTHVVIGKSKSKLIINLGPYASYLDKEDEKTNISNNDSLNFVGYPADRKFDFGYCLGVGYEYRTRLGTFGIEARYYNSLTNIFIRSTEIPYFASTNQALTIGVKYSISIFKQNRRRNEIE